MKKKPYDPKLREVALEFEALCKKYDVAGFGLFVSPTHAEFMNHLTPSWSVVRIENGNTIRFRSTQADFKTKEAQKFSTEASVHMLTSSIEWSRKVNEAMRNVIVELGRHMQIMWAAWNKPDSVPGDGK